MTPVDSAAEPGVGEVPPGGSDAKSAPGLRHQMRAGAISWGLGSLAARTSQVLVQLVLAWLLSPTDYGLVAMTAAFMLVLQTVSEFGVGVAVIQKNDMPASYPATAFWLNLAMSVAMFLLASAGAPWLARFYGTPEVTALTRVSAAGFLITALRIIPMAMLRKRLRFGTYAALDSFSTAAGGLLSVLFAWLGAGYWSLVIPSMIMGVVMAPAWFYFSEWRPTLTLRFSALREILDFSANVVGVSLLSLVLATAGFILVGHEQGPNLAGMFKFATDNAMFIVTNFSWTVAGVVLSGFALQQNEPERLRRSFQRAFTFLLATTFPIHAALFALAPWLFSGVFPAKWAPVVPLFRVLIVWSAIRSFTAHLNPFLNAANRARVGLVFVVVMTATTLPAMVVTSHTHGAMGVAVSSAFFQSVCTFVMLAVLRRVMGWREGIPYLRSSAAYVLSSIAAAALAFGTAEALTRAGTPRAVTFCAAAMFSGVAYGALLYIFAYRRLYEIVDDACPERFRPWVARILPQPEA